MLRNVLSVTLFAFSLCLACSATTVLAAESNDQAAEISQCSQGECAAICEKDTCKAAVCSGDRCSASACDSDSCAAKKCSSDTCSTKKCSAGACSGKACSSADTTLVTVADSNVDDQCAAGGCCAAGACCKTEASETACCKTAKECSACTTEEVVVLVDVVSDCPCASATAETTGCDTKCECGSECKCSKTASAHLAVLHKRLVRENAKIAELTAQIQMHEAVAQAREEFNARMLAKDVELVHLQAQLKLADERTVLNQKVAAAVAENVQIQASLRVAQCQTETLKHQIAQRSHDVTAALADSHANNAKLTQRIVELEKQLEILNVRLAEKPTDKQVQ